MPVLSAVIVTPIVGTGVTVTTTALEGTGVVGAHKALLTISTVIEFGVPRAVPVVL